MYNLKLSPYKEIIERQHTRESLESETTDIVYTLNSEYLTLHFLSRKHLIFPFLHAHKSQLTIMVSPCGMSSPFFRVQLLGFSDTEVQLPGSLNARKEGETKGGIIVSIKKAPLINLHVEPLFC